jgi:ADP-ribose pyrophosphatase
MAAAADRNITMRRNAVIRRHRRLLDDFFKVYELVVSHEQRDGTMSADERRLVLERGDAVAVLLLERDSRSVILVEQFKAPVLIGRRREDRSTTDRWILETVAGMIDPGETAEAAVIRETQEETGYQIHEPQLIARFFSSPGGTSERVFLYFAEVSAVDRKDGGGGISDEDIAVVYMPLDQLFDRLASGAIEDPKLLISARWLRDRIQGQQ